MGKCRINITLSTTASFSYKNPYVLYLSSYHFYYKSFCKTEMFLEHMRCSMANFNTKSTKELVCKRILSLLIKNCYALLNRFEYLYIN